MSPQVPTPDASGSRRRTLRIAICLQQLASLREMLDQGFASDGTYVVQGYIAKGLQARGHHLSFVAPGELGEIECAIDLGQPRRVARTWSARRWFHLARATAWRTQRLLGVPYLNVFDNYRLVDGCLQCLPGHDVVYERNALYSLGVAKACRRLGLPYVMFFEADQLLEHAYIGRPLSGLLRWRAARVLRYNLKVANCVICVSDTARLQLLSTWGVEPRKTVVCRNGVDVQRFRPDPDARAEARTRLGLGETLLVVFVGSFFEWHDVAALIDSFALMRAAGHDARLILAGEGRLLDAMRQHAQAAGMTGAVEFTGLMPHAEIPKLLGAADIAVAPYPRMAHDLWMSPLKLFEYMASGVAIVASDTGQVGQVIRHASNGLLVPPSDVRALAAALAQLATNPELRMRLGAQAREDALREHSWERYIDRLETVFHAVLDRRSLEHLTGLGAGHDPASRSLDGA